MAFFAYRNTAWSRWILIAAPFALAAGCKQEAPPPPPPPEVEVVDVAQRDQPIVAEWIGTTDGFVNADIRAQVAGYLLRQDYTDGASVKKGDLLFEIDPRPFQATYRQIKANFDKAVLDLQRETELYRTQAAARQDYDNAVQAHQAAKAALEEAALNLDFTRIVSPIDGIAGIALAQIGNLVGPGTASLTTVSTVDPIKVYFSIDEQTYLYFKRLYPSREVLRQNLSLELVLSDGSVYPQKGRVYAADREVDPNTGTLRIAAEFPNPGNFLRPGQYGRVRAVVRTVKGALLVPQRAVSELQGAYQVATVDRNNRAHLRTVKVGDRVGSWWVIEDGLRPDDRVVAEGIQKVKEGLEVNPRPFTTNLAGK